MHIDPRSSRPGPSPYDVLWSAGIGPDSTTQDIFNASFELMAEGRMNATARQAWDELRHPSRRLLVDFFLYDRDLAAELARLGQALAERSRAPEEPATGGEHRRGPSPEEGGA